MVDAYELERRGIPTITICHDRFEVPARIHAETLGMPDLPLLIEPVPRGGTISHDVETLADAHFESVVTALTAATAADGREPGQ